MINNDTGVVGQQICPGCRPDIDPNGRDVVTVSWCYQHQPKLDGSADSQVPVSAWITSSVEADGHDCREIQRLIT